MSTVRLVGTIVVIAAAVCRDLRAQNVTMATGPSTLVLEREIGTELGPEEYSFGMIADIAVMSDETIFVLDVMSSNVKVYTGAGTYLRSFGRAGGGPGEFLRPLRIQADSVLRVFDMAQNRITVFEPDGHLKETVRLPSVRGINVTRLFRMRSGKLVAGTTPGLSWGSPAHQESVTVFVEDPVTFEIDTIITYHSGATIWYLPDRRGPWGVAETEFGPGGAWAVNDSIVATVDGYTGAVRWSTVGAELAVRREERLSFESRAVTPGDLSRAKRAFRDLRQRLGQPLPDFEFHAPERWSVGTEALFASDGRLWVANGRSADRRHVWTVFSEPGRPPVVRSLPAEFTLRFATADRLYGVSTTASGAQVVRVYSVR